MKRLSWFSLLVILIIVFTGCIPNIQSTQKVQASSTTFFTATHTIISTSIPTLTITETPSPAPTINTKIVLEHESIQKTIQPLILNPMNCVDLCFMGIVPGKTNSDEVKAFFYPFGFQQREGTDPNSSRDFYSVGYEDIINRDSNVTFIFKNNLVESIKISPDISNQSTKIPREWIAYSPETLIKKFGQPSRVQFALDWGPNMYNTIAMIMYFDDLDFIALYSGDNMIPGNPYSPNLCPLNMPFDRIRFWMGKNPLSPPTFETVPLEEATSLTIEQFTNLMLGDPESACFTLNGDAFE